jgi:UDP-N-acetylglucosamine transferase subunit ALG13
MDDNTLFCTVGTTKFPFLSSFVASLSFLAFVSSTPTSSSNQGAAPLFKSVIIQYGHGVDPLLKHPLRRNTDVDDVNDSDGTYTSKITLPSGTVVKAFAFAPTLTPFVQQSSHIICHAGVGSIIEGLEEPFSEDDGTTKKKRKVMAIVNDELMGNHQEEVASALEKRNVIKVGRRLTTKTDDDNDVGNDDPNYPPILSLFKEVTLTWVPSNWENFNQSMIAYRKEENKLINNATVFNAIMDEVCEGM